MIERVEKIYSVFKRRRYNLEEPFSGTELKKRLQSFVDRKVPIKLVGFWGVGTKSQPNWADRAMCDWLEDMQMEMRKAYKHGMEYTFVLETPHGVLAGLDPDIVNSYAEGMEELFTEYRFRSVRLETLWQKYEISLEKIGKINAVDPSVQKSIITRDLEKEMWRKEFGAYIFHALSDAKTRDMFPALPTIYFYPSEEGSDTPWLVV